MHILSTIFNYTQLALAAVVVTEGTLSQDTGANKQKLAIDLIDNEAQVAGFAVPAIQPFIPSFVNMAVAAFNLVGLFTHKKA